MARAAHQESRAVHSNKPDEFAVFFDAAASTFGVTLDNVRAVQRALQPYQMNLFKIFSSLFAFLVFEKFEALFIFLNV